MSAMTHPDAIKLFEEILCSNAKLCASSTTNTQGADVSNMFPGVHREAKIIKPKDCWSTTRQAEAVTEALKEINGLHIATPKLSAFANLAAAIPCIFSRAGIHQTKTRAAAALPWRLGRSRRRRTQTRTQTRTQIPTPTPTLTLTPTPT